MPDCNKVKIENPNSFQIFANGSATDNSQFARTFANILINNFNQCISIEQIVAKVSDAVRRSNQGEPVFARIRGFDDQKGSFVFYQRN